jgi:hypothetical protein
MVSQSRMARLRRGLMVCAATFCLAGLVALAVPQAPEEETSRRLWPPEFRPASAKSGAKPKVARYRRTTPALPKDAIAAEAAGDAVVGVTIWRLRPAKATDEARILVTKSGRKTDWTPERVEAGTQLTEGQMVRLSIEVPRTGYLYVIDREQYADGTLSDPYLIFPLNPESEDHKVTAGRVIELPNQADEQAYFEVKSLRDPGQAAQIAELLTVLVTPAPLTDLPKPARNAQGEMEPLLLAKALVESWEKQWGAQTEQLEMESGAGQAYTRAEQAAGKSASRRLTAEDPLPQTIFRVAVKPGRPLLVRLPLRIGK